MDESMTSISSNKIFSRTELDDFIKKNLPFINKKYSTDNLQAVKTLLLKIPYISLYTNYIVCIRHNYIVCISAYTACIITY